MHELVIRIAATDNRRWRAQESKTCVIDTTNSIMLNQVHLPRTMTDVPC